MFETTKQTLMFGNQDCRHQNLLLISDPLGTDIMQCSKILDQTHVGHRGSVIHNLQSIEGRYCRKASNGNEKFTPAGVS